MFIMVEQSYAKEIFEEQLNMGSFGLNSEAKEICQKFCQPNACLKYVHRKLGFNQARLSNLKKLKEDMEGLSKMKDSKAEDYMKRVSLEGACIEFLWRMGNGHAGQQGAV